MTAARTPWHLDRDDIALVAFAGVVALAAFNLLWRLDTADLHFDEPLYGRDGWHAIHGDVPVADHPAFGKMVIGLSQLIWGRTPGGMRLLPVLFALAGVFAVYGLGRRYSRWTGVIAAAMWATLGRDLVVAGHSTIDTRIDRYALLDTISTPLQLGAVWAVLWWGDRPSGRRAALTGLLAGLAVATKISAGTVLVVVVLVMAAGAAPRAAKLRGAAWATLVAVGSFAAVHLPFGTAAPEYIRRGIEFQIDHGETGHVQVLGERAYVRQPWWANTYLWWEADGLLVVVVLVLALAAWWGRDRLTTLALWSMAALTFGALSMSRVALPHYRVQWLAPIMILAAAGLTGVWATRETRARVGVAVLGAALVGAGLVGTWDIATIDRGPYQHMAADVRGSGTTPPLAITFGTDITPYLPETRSVFGSFAQPTTPTELLVIERQFAMSQLYPDRLEAMRARARDAGLTRRIDGDLEYWYRP